MERKITNKMKFNKLAALGIASWLAFAPAAAKAESILKKFEYGISAGIQYNANNFNQSNLDNVNQEFKDGKYTASAPVPDWKNITSENPLAIPIEFSVLYKPTEKIKAGLVGVVENAKGESNYSGDYNVWDSITSTYVPLDFKRKEDIDVNSNSFGIKAEAKLKDWLTAFITAKQDNYSVSGKVDYEMTRVDTAVTQWRDMKYSGSGMGNSLELGADFNLSKNIAVGLSAGSRSGKVQTKGQEIITQSSNPGTVITRDYNPEFDFNSSYGEVKMKLRF